MVQPVWSVTSLNQSERMKGYNPYSYLKDALTQLVKCGRAR